jgi:hypothetical protein
MMDNLPVYMRIATLTPTNEDVTARRAAIGALSTAWRKINDVGKILSKAEMVAGSLAGDGQPSALLGMEVQEAVQKHASAFLYEESPLEVGICAGLAVVSIVNLPPTASGWTTSNVYSNALWSALAFQPPLVDQKREALRRDVLQAAQRASREAADKARERSAVPDMGDLTVTLAEDSKPITTFKKATESTIEALRRNATLDREELDFLWWVQLNRSRLLKKPFVGMAEPLRLVSSGIEAARHLRRLPADLHYDLVLRSVDKDPELDLTELIEIIGDDRTLLAASFNSTRAAACPAVFPLLHALATGVVNTSGANAKHATSTWAGRALLEAGLNRMCEQGIMKL